MQQSEFWESDQHKVVSIKLAEFGRLLAIELNALWHQYYRTEELPVLINTTLALARVHQIEQADRVETPAPDDDGRLNQTVANWEQLTQADADAAEAEMWKVLGEVEKNLAAEMPTATIERLSNAAHNVSMAWDGFMLADIAFAKVQIAQRPTQWLNEAFAEIIAQTISQEVTNGTE